jgi:hypothetical protein
VKDINPGGDAGYFVLIISPGQFDHGRKIAAIREDGKRTIVPAIKPLECDLANVILGRYGSGR